MVVESKIMKRWEFDSVKQASTLIASWFSGNPFECQLLQDYLTNISSNGKSTNSNPFSFIFFIAGSTKDLYP
jgi:hypothetical protein